MINVSQAFQDAWLNGKQKYIQLDFSDNTSLDDNSIVSESFSMRQALCEESQLAFGLTSSTEVSIKIFNNNKQYKGLYMSILVGAVDDEENYYTMDLGTYKIENDVRSDDRLYRTLTAYDALYNVLNNDYSGWYNNLSSTFTLKQFRDSFFTHIGITQESFTLIQDNVTLNKKPNVSSLSGKDIIQGICETSAAFGFINYDGKFQYVTPTVGTRHFPADDLFPSNDLYPGDGGDIVVDISNDESAPIMGGLSYSDYYTHKITGAKFQYSENTAETSVGTSTNVYQFADSILFYGQTTNSLQGIANGFLSASSTFFYIPASIKTRARIWAQLGDILIVHANENSVLMPILERSMEGITALYDTYISKGTEYYTYSANSMSQRILENEAVISEVSDTVDELDDDINNPVTGVKVTIEKTATDIKSTVAGSQKEWDITGYTVTLFGYDTPDNEGYDASEYNGAYYLNQTTGWLYLSNGSSWTYVKACSTIQSVLSSEIYQNEQQIALKVSKGSVSSELSVESGQITLSSGRLVINSGNFTLDSYGSAAGKDFVAKDSLRIKSAANNYNNGIIITTDYYNNGIYIKDINGGYYKDVYCASLIASTNITANGYTMATQNWVGNQGYITSSGSCSYATSAGSANAVFWSNVSGKPTIPSDSDEIYGTEAGSNDNYKWSNSSSNHYAARSGWVSDTFQKKGTGSDIRLKEQIQSFDIDTINDIYIDLKPVNFRYHSDIWHGKNKKVYYGLIAQDLISTMSEHGIDYKDTEIIHEERSDNEEFNDGIDKYISTPTFYEINYDELHAWHIVMIQKQQKEIDALKDEVAELKAMLKEVINVGKSE